MQSSLLDSEARRTELETGVGLTQDTLRRTMKERDAARTEATTLLAKLEETGLNDREKGRMVDAESACSESVTAFLKGMYWFVC